MAEVKTTKKAAVKKAAPKAKLAAAPAPIPASTLTPADIAMIAEIAAKAATEAVRATLAAPDFTPTKGNGPGGKRAEADIPDVWPADPAEVANMTDEQVEGFNRRQTAKMSARKSAQADNLSKTEGLDTKSRKELLNEKRDPSIIRRAVPPGWKGDEDDLVRVIAMRRIGLAEGMSDLHETLDIPRESAKALQSSGAIEIAL